MHSEDAIEVLLWVGLEIEYDNPFIRLHILMLDIDGVLELFLGLSQVETAIKLKIILFPQLVLSLGAIFLDLQDEFVAP